METGTLTSAIERYRDVECAGDSQAKDDRRGLLARPERSVSGQRQYPVHVVTMLRMIKNARHLGFSLDEITSLIASDRDPDGVQAIAARKLAETDAEIARLTLMRQALALTASIP